jgi:hypothetical protein
MMTFLMSHIQSYFVLKIRPSPLLGLFITHPRSEIFSIKDKTAGLIVFLEYQLSCSSFR